MFTPFFILSSLTFPPSRSFFLSLPPSLLSSFLLYPPNSRVLPSLPFSLSTFSSLHFPSFAPISLFPPSYFFSPSKILPLSSFLFWQEIQRSSDHISSINKCHSIFKAHFTSHHQLKTINTSYSKASEQTLSYL